MYDFSSLRLGRESYDARLLQLALKRAGYYDGAINGVFDSDTAEALKYFQKNIGVCGGFGQAVKRLLCDQLKGYRLYDVRPGDTLYSAAEKLGATLKAMTAANPDVSPMCLKAGSKLIAPYGFKVVPDDVPLTSALMDIISDGLIARYPFITQKTVGRSVMGRPLYCFSIGKGENQVFFNAVHHANEWICGLVLLKYLENYAEALVKGDYIGSQKASELYEKTTLYIMPLVNPDGADLVTGYLKSGPFYNRALKISGKYPDIPFPDGWKANISGVDLNLQYPAGWEEARTIKYSQGYVSPAPRDYVGPAALTAPESKAVYDFTVGRDFSLTLSYHTQGQVIYHKYLDLTPPLSDYIGGILSDASGYVLESAPYDSGHAGYKDWFILKYFRPGYTVEAGLGTSPLPLSALSGIYKDNEELLTMAQILT